MKSSHLSQSAKSTLHAKFHAASHSNGYVVDWKDNLLPGIHPANVEADLRGGAGQELDTKFKALHSSSALAVNTFAPFKANLGALALAGHRGFTHLQFEKQLPTGLRGYSPNLDVWLERENEVIAIESKFLEYLTPKAAKFSASYTRAALPQVDNAWWDVLQASLNAPSQYLDTAQLVKHALGLLKYQQANPTMRVSLVYLFWEPVNAAAFTVCHQHRAQVQDVANQVAGSSLKFQALSYNELWAQWNSEPLLAMHLHNLRSRYEFAV